MSVISKYWENIAKRLQVEHPENKPPADWTRAEAKPWLERIESKAEAKISYATFRRIFREHTEGSVDTRNIFARYFDCEDYPRYIEKYLQKQPIITDASIVPEKPRSTSKKYWLLSILLLVPIGFYFFQKSSNKQMEQEILEVVEKAIHCEFDAYSAIPDYKTKLPKLQALFWEDSSAYNTIMDVLEGQRIRNWTLQNDLNPSMVKPYKITFDNIHKNQAYVTTKEHWKLEWYSEKLRRYEYSYDVINTQTYTLDKSVETGKWKISVNTYRGHKERIIPRVIPCSELETSTSELTKLSARIAVEGSNVHLTLRLLTCFYDGQNLPLPNELSLLIAKQNNLNRDLNTDKIEYDAYLPRKEKLLEEVLEFVEQI